jgi:hypothetical protein
MERPSGNRMVRIDILAGGLRESRRMGEWMKPEAARVAIRLMTAVEPRSWHQVGMPVRLADDATPPKRLHSRETSAGTC